MNELLIRGLMIDWTKIDQTSYLRKIPALNKLESLTFTKPVTFFIGENGSGKSTSLEAIAMAYGFNPEGGTKNYHFSTYDSHSELYGHLRLAKGIRKARWGYFLRAESFYNVATQEEDYADSSHPSDYFHQKSHGESFLTMMEQQFQADSIYFLDEPEAALSPQRQLALLRDIFELTKEGSQFIIATHSPILLGIPEASILSFDETLQEIKYEDTTSYQITKMFINDREHLLSKLLEE